MWDSPPLPLNIYNILLRLTDFDNLPKKDSKKLIWNSWLKTSIDTESIVQCY